MDNDFKFYGKTSKGLLFETKTGERIYNRWRYVKIIFKNLNVLRIAITTFCLIATTSCSKPIDHSDHNVNFENLFYELGKELEKDQLLLKRTIEEYELKVHPNLLYADYKKNTVEYFKYLNKVDSLGLKSESNIFFDNDNLTPEGVLFINKSSDYVNSISPLVTDENLKLRINHLIGVEDRLTEDNIYVSYINWYFNGAPKSVFCYLLKKRRRNVLVIQKEILNRILLTQC